MSLKKIITTVGGVLVAGIIIAGDTLGWKKFLPQFSSAHISVSSTTQPNSKVFFADEKIWITLSEVDTDKVYWVFDESNNVISGGIQLQYSFPFDTTAPVGRESKRRIDAFYKVGDDYQHDVARVLVRNTQIKANSSFGAQGLELTLSTKVPGEWKLDTVQLSQLSKGEFRNIALEPRSATKTDMNARVVWNGSEVASELGYTSSEEVGVKLMSDKTVWVSAEYASINTGETFTLFKPLDVEKKP